MKHAHTWSDVFFVILSSAWNWLIEIHWNFIILRSTSFSVTHSNVSLPSHSAPINPFGVRIRTIYFSHCLKTHIRLEAINLCHNHRLQIPCMCLSTHTYKFGHLRCLKRSQHSMVMLNGMKQQNKYILNMLLLLASRMVGIIELIFIWFYLHTHRRIYFRVLDY